MSVFYPDNPNREARARQLLDQTTTLQATFVSYEESIDASQKEAQEILPKLAQAAKYATPEAYAAAGLKTLTKADRERYLNMCDSMVRYNPDLKRSITAFGVIGSIGFGLNLGVKKITAVYCKMSVFVSSMKGILRGLVKIFQGSFVDGLTMIKTFARAIKVNWGRKLVGGPGGDLSNTAMRNLTWLRRAGKVLQWASVFAEIGLLIYQGVQEEKDRDMLRNMIIETASSRFAVKKLELIMNEVKNYVQKTTSFLNLVRSFTKRLNDGKITQKEFQDEVAEEWDPLVQSFEESMQNCNKDDKVEGQLKQLDDRAGAWRNEDPTIDKMLAWLKEHPLKDDQGVEVPLDGPQLDKEGLVWSAAVGSGASRTAPPLTTTQVDFTAWSEQEKPQKFEKLYLHVRIELNGDPNSEYSATSLFLGRWFGKQGSPEARDGYISVSQSNGTAGVDVSGALAAVQVLIDNVGYAYIRIPIAKAAGAESIVIPKGGKITISVTGKTASTGETNCMGEEQFWPLNPAGQSEIKLYTDIIIAKR